MKYYYLFIALFLLLGFVNSISIDEVVGKTQSLYLVNILDGNDAVRIASYSKVICPSTYWVLPSSLGDYVFLDDTKPNSFVSRQKARELIKTVFFFNNIHNLNYNSQTENYFNAINLDLEDYRNNLILIKKSLKDESLIKQIDVILDDLQEIVKENKNIKEEISVLKELVYEKRYSCDSRKNIVDNAKKLGEDLDNLQEKYSELKNNVNWLIQKVQDSNMSLNEKANIISLLKLPQSFNYFNTEKTYLDQSEDVVLKASYEEDDFKIDLLLNKWQQRKDMALFLEAYLKKDKEVKAKTKKENLKELFDFILMNKGRWRSSEYNSFEKGYNEMIKYLELKQYANAKLKLENLKRKAISIYELGFKTQNYEEEKTNSWYYYIVGFFILLLIILKTIAYFKKKSEEVDEDEEENLI